MTPGAVSAAAVRRRAERAPIVRAAASRSKPKRSGGGDADASDLEGVAGGFDVVLELGHQRVDAVELALAAQEVHEPHLGPLAIEIVGEVEQVGLEQRVVGVLVERGAAP